MAKEIREQNNFKGNREHLDILLYAMKKNTISFWNTWREKNSSKISPSITPNGMRKTGSICIWRRK